MARTQLSFASCNLYNLNLANLPMYRDKKGWSKDQYLKKIEWLAHNLRYLRADVWGFQELWHRQALDAAFAEAKLKSSYRLLVPKGHAGGRIVCAGAVRKDILDQGPEWIDDFPDGFRLESQGDDPQTPSIDTAIRSFSRPVLRFSVRPKVNSKAITVYVVHFKSKLPTGLYKEPWYQQDKSFYSRHQSAIGAGISTIRRTAEAIALRMILTEDMKNNDKPVVVIGDMNDGQHSNTLNIITGQPRYLLSGSKGGGDTSLYACGSLQEYRSHRDVYYTHMYQNLRESLDHILVSQELYDNSRKRVWGFKGLEVLNDHVDLGDHKQAGTPDHGVIRASFEYRPAPKPKNTTKGKAVKEKTA